MSKALSGVLVISLEQAVAAPYCSSRLADAGAEVIKVERADGDFARRYDQVVHGESAYFVWLNRGKKSAVLNIKDADDKALLLEMIQQADVFIENLAPGAARRAGLISGELRASNPRLITCSISGYGESGPYADMKAYDLLVQCESALASITGSPAEPGRIGISICDIACGMYAYAAILEALLNRDRTGEGATLKVSLFGAAADLMTVPLLHTDYGGEAPQRVGLHHPSIAPYGAYADCNGTLVMIAIQNEREWARLCEHVLGDTSLVDDPRFSDNTQRVRHRDELDAIISDVFSHQSSEAIIESLKSSDIAFGAVNDVSGLSAHPQLQRTTISTPTGPATIVAPPVVHDGNRVDLGPVPALGEHTDEVRRRFAPTDPGASP